MLVEGRLDKHPGVTAATALPNARRWASMKASRGVLRWAVALVLFVACALFVDLRETIAILLRVPSYWIVFILILWTLDRFLMAWKWSFLLRALGVEIRIATLTRFYYQANFTGTFLPSSVGGDLLRGYWVAKSSGGRHEVYAALVMEKVIGFLSAVNWAVAGGLVLAAYLGTQIGSYWIAAALGGALLLNSLAVFSLHGVCSRMMQRMIVRIFWSRALVFFQRLCEAYAQFSRRRRALFRNALLTLIEHAVQIGIVFAMARSLDIRIDAVPFLAVTAVYLLIYRFPVSPDGWGVGEVTAVGLFGLIGVSAESGFALAFLSHVLQTIVILPGLWFLWRSGFAAPAVNKAGATGISN
jgi:glycosyltransferase 2 family protein